MEFMKENWAKILMAVIGVVGLILTFLLFPVPGVEVGEGLEAHADAVALSKTYMLIAQIVFFSALVIYPILGMFEVTKKFAGYILLGFGAIALVLVILSMTSASAYLADAQAAIDAGREAYAGNETALATLDIKQYALTTGSYTTFVNLLIFALAPIVYAVRKLVKTN